MNESEKTQSKNDCGTTLQKQGKIQKSATCFTQCTYGVRKPICEEADSVYLRIYRRLFSKREM